MIGPDGASDLEPPGGVEDFDYLEDEPPPSPKPAGEEVQLGEPAADVETKWEEEAVEEHLKMTGSIVHDLWGKAEEDWVMSERDLERMAPPLTRILNRYEPTARMAVASDPILRGYGTALYSDRSILQARAAVAARREAAEAAEHDTGIYENIPPPGSVPGNSGRPRGALRFPDAAREDHNDSI